MGVRGQRRNGKSYPKKGRNTKDAEIGKRMLLIS